MLFTRLIVVSSIFSLFAACSGQSYTRTVDFSTEISLSDIEISDDSIQFDLSPEDYSAFAQHPMFFFYILEIDRALACRDESMSPRIVAMRDALETWKTSVDAGVSHDEANAQFRERLASPDLKALVSFDASRQQDGSYRVQASCGEHANIEESIALNEPSR